MFGTVAGLLELLIGIIFLFFGDYIAFISRTKVMKVLYKLENHPVFTDLDGFLNFDNISLPMAYFKNFSDLKCCFACFRTDKDKEFTRIFKVADQRLVEDFDFKTVLDYLKTKKDEV